MRAEEQDCRSTIHEGGKLLDESFTDFVGADSSPQGLFSPVTALVVERGDDNAGVVPEVGTANRRASVQCFDLDSQSAWRDAELFHTRRRARFLCALSISSCARAIHRGWRKLRLLRFMERKASQTVRQPSLWWQVLTDKADFAEDKNFAEEGGTSALETA